MIQILRFLTIIALYFALSACVPAQESILLSASQVAPVDVKTADGGASALVDSVIVDPTDGHIRYVVIELPAVAHSYNAARYPSRVPVPWRALDYDYSTGSLLIPGDMSTLEAAPHLLPPPPGDEMRWKEDVDQYWSDQTWHGAAKHVRRATSPTTLLFSAQESLLQ